MPRTAVFPIVRVVAAGGAAPSTDQDLVAVEAPLEILAGGTPLGIFMRTPGDDAAMAMGMLFAEGIITQASDITGAELTLEDDGSGRLVVTLAPGVAMPDAALARAGIATSACGLCGRLAGETAKLRTRPDAPDAPDAPSPSLISSLTRGLREAQAVFAETGGLHAAGFFSADGVLVDIAEDVGRHNAVDKLVGRALAAGRLPARGLILVVSGRVAFEIVQKAAMAGVETLVAVGAPTSLAVRAARETGLTLIGFARDGAFNIYSNF